MTEKSLTTLDLIAAYLKGHGCIEVRIEYPGCVVVWAEDLVDHPDHAWWFGTANGTWQGDLMNGSGEYLDQTLSTGVSASADWEQAARAIARVLSGEPVA
jgi:hypothetical protein